MNRSGKYYGAASTLVFGIAVLFVTRFILFSDFHNIIFLMPDDSSYYLKIAESFTEGKGFTFDGINPTNGFQPLWQYLLTGILFLVKSDPETTLRIVLVIQVLILCISAFIIYKLLIKYFGQKIILAVCVCYTIFVFMQSINGMETSLLVLMITILFYFADSRQVFIKQNRFNEVVFGIIFGLIILTRLDSVFLQSHSVFIVW